MMGDRYEPASDFLKACLVDAVPLSGSAWAEQNLHRLVALTADDDLSNRDWATLLLAQTLLDTPTVRAALLHAAGDADEFVRGEAALGLAQRDTDLALPFVQAALAADRVNVPMLEAAALCAHPSLVADLRTWTEPSDDQFLDGLAATALAACEAAQAKLTASSHLDIALGEEDGTPTT